MLTALDAAKELEAKGIDAEVIDLRTLVPLDFECSYINIDILWLMARKTATHPKSSGLEYSLTGLAGQLIIILSVIWMVGQKIRATKYMIFSTSSLVPDLP